MKVKLLNKIAKVGLDQFDANYECSEDFQDYDAIMVRSAKLHDVEFSKDLKCIARAGAGVNNIPLDRCSEEGIVVFNTPGANANAVKELVIAALVLSGRKIAQGINWVKSIADDDDLSKQIEKGKSNFVGPEIAGKKLGVIGLGAIGVQVANAAAAMDMEVYGYDPYISVQAAWTLKARINHAKDLKTIFEECDYITVHVPYNEATKNIVNAEAFDQMKDGVRILNFARNGLIDEDALVKALASGKVGGYITDFPSKELLQFDNVLGVPHLGASTPESEENCAVMAANEIRDYLENGNITHSVNMPDIQMAQEAKYRLCIINKNIPNMVGEMTTKLANVGINIENMANKAKKDYAYTILETNDEISAELLDKLAAQDGIKSVRLIVK
ncbi:MULTISPECIES: 3-phosphoglycerate dehydrogenase family protein [Bacillota]|jgi:D-3-phosphoglycerate dehydrogenase|uniref:3-phosphoglycerate dehydrogenase n=2 Tax=Amedibacillus TaxID=2749846 RepID=A0A7G9GJ90_9FIRM|nr:MULTISPECIES: 3-phosphoglycerate dehydrogenase family protein [Bacillota]QNM10872.1 3-phosphoglycerate dehydrogenase [[Eubacterium] hominis]MCH4285305.1 3-phosphoglycerate dehydrogenase family protein [Amedibacillus hominis]RGB58367.1 3-phosphoglycerate dehydrogenase [Absiella sp. AM22-9]RGB63254.1 3-phosphoglycerate dehydrogenase [Absiella sp. AM10-20]RGB65124.1 3-phosphoglycerate dehydrogenase [Absiella sp. AM09-45]